MATLVLSVSTSDLIDLTWSFVTTRLVERYRQLFGEVATVVTKSGLVRGHKIASSFDYKYFNFHGIPYAKPPIGDLRFKVRTMVYSLAVPEIEN